MSDGTVSVTRRALGQLKTNSVLACRNCGHFCPLTSLSVNNDRWCFACVDGGGCTPECCAIPARMVKKAQRGSA